MKKRRFNIVVLLGALALIVLFISQFIWITRLTEIKDQNFDNRVKSALGNVGNQIQLINREAIYEVYPVTKIADDQYVVMINDLVQPRLLDSLISYEFRDYEITLPYYYGIYDCHTDSVITFNHKLLHSNEFAISTWDPNTHNFGIIFPTKNDFLSNWSNLLVSGSIVLIVMALFAYFIYVIFQQKQVDEIKTDFVNNMTHELKTPISTISLSSEALMKPNITEKPERISRYSKIIHEEAEKLKLRVERVLQVALFSDGKLNLKKENFDLIELVNQVIKDNNVRMEKCNGTIAFSSQTEIAEVHMDKNHMYNVIDNLIDNAIKYCENSPKIEIYLKDHNIIWSLSVSDNGIGISQEHQKRVFDKFYRVPTGNIHDVKGFGIGLNYCSKILEAHSGSIKVTSKTSKGSTFILEIPKG